MLGEDIKKDERLTIPSSALPDSTHLQLRGVPVLDTVSTASIYYYLLFIYLSVDSSPVVLSSLPLNYVSVGPRICAARRLVEGAASRVCCSPAPSRAASSFLQHRCVE